MKSSVRHHGAYSLSYAQYGDPNGFPILAQHGLIAGIDDGGLFHRLVAAGARVICAARPGYGLSSPYEMADLAGWGDVMEALVKELGLERFDVLGISSGAPYSYALGYHFSQQARNIYILSGTPALFDARVVAGWPWEVKKNARLDEMQDLAEELFFAHLAPRDLEKVDIRDSRANHCFGLGQDFRLRGMDWGFCMEEVRQPVFMRHSRADDSVPLATAQLTAAMLPNCRLEVREQDPHFSPQVLDDFIQTTILDRLIEGN